MLRRIALMLTLAAIAVLVAAPASMSRKLWVRFLHYLQGAHREIALERPLLAAPQGYLRRQSARAHLVGEHSHYPRPPLYLLKQALQHVRRAYPGVVASWVT